MVSFFNRKKREGEVEEAECLPEFVSVPLRGSYFCANCESVVFLVRVALKDGRCPVCDGKGAILPLEKWLNNEEGVMR